jgi:dienelactone hydrolase
MAAQYVRDNSTRVQGVVLMGAYPGNSVDLSKLPIKIVSICGDNDGLVTEAKIQHALPQLPPDVQVITLQGGNHAQFGNYGPQAGDGVATMSREEQQAKTVEAIAAMMKQISISILERNGKDGWRERN